MLSRAMLSSAFLFHYFFFLSHWLHTFHDDYQQDRIVFLFSSLFVCLFVVSDEIPTFFFRFLFFLSVFYSCGQNQHDDNSQKKKYTMNLFNENKSPSLNISELNESRLTCFFCHQTAYYICDLSIMFIKIPFYFSSMTKQNSFVFIFFIKVNFVIQYLVYVSIIVGIYWYARWVMFRNLSDSLSSFLW